MNDEEWVRIHQEQEREAFLAVLKDAFRDVPPGEKKNLIEEFKRCLENGGAASAYAMTGTLSWLQVPVLYPLVIEYFIRARRPLLADLTKPERRRRAQEHLRLAKQLKAAREAVLAHSDGPSWCIQLEQTLDVYSDELLSLADEAQANSETDGPGRLKNLGTPLALSLNALFRGQKVAETTRCALIAGMVSAFIEPVTGEQIRQRFKDHRRRSKSRL